MISMQPQPAGLPSGTFGGRRSSQAGAWQWRRLLSSPHRLAFWAGSVLLALGSLWWGATLALGAAGVALPWAVRPALAQALLMGFGFLPLFVMGFLMTTGSGWLGLHAVPGRLLVVPVFASLLGWAVAVVGFHFSAPLAALGMAAAAVGVALVAGLYGLLLLESRSQDRRHAVLALVGCAVLIVAQWLASITLVLGQLAATSAALQAGLWGGLGLVFVAVAHRLMPALLPAGLSLAAAWRSRLVLNGLALLVVCQALLSAAEALAGGVMTPVPAALRAAMELPAGAVLMLLSLTWGLRICHAARLLSLLYLGFFWLGVSLTLGGLSHGLMSLSDGVLSLGDAPVQAFAMGFLGNVFLAMATAVVRGLSGRDLRPDNWVLLISWALQVAVLAKVCAALWPHAATPLGLLAAQFWVAAMGAWVLRHMGWLGRPRVDGGGH